MKDMAKLEHLAEYHMTQQIMSEYLVNQRTLRNQQSVSPQVKV